MSDRYESFYASLNKGKEEYDDFPMPWKRISQRIVEEKLDGHEGLADLINEKGLSVEVTEIFDRYLRIFEEQWRNQRLFEISQGAMNRNTKQDSTKL